MKEKQESAVQAKLDSITNDTKLGAQVYAELKVQYPKIQSAIIQPSTAFEGSAKSKKLFLVLINLNQKISNRERDKLEKWLKVRLQELHPKDSLSLLLH